MPGPMVLPLHGWGGSFKRIYADNGWVGALQAAGRKVVAMDLPGHGEGTHSDRPEDYGDLAGAVAEHLPEGPLDLIGYSLGGKLALELASRWPERFARIVIGGLGDNIFAPEANGAALASTLEQGVTAQTPPGLAAFADYAIGNGNHPRAVAAVLRRPPNPVATPERLGQIRSRILIVNGNCDRTARPDGKLVGALRDVTHILLPDVDHLSLPGVEAFRSLAVSFLESPEDQKARDGQVAAAH